MDGFPAGPPETVTLSDTLHLVVGGLGFLGLIGACALLGRWFRRRGDSRWATFSLVTGGVYLVTFAGIATGAGNAAVVLAFTAAVVLAWTWITMLFARAARDVAPTPLTPSYQSTAA